MIQMLGKQVVIIRTELISITATTPTLNIQNLMVCHSHIKIHLLNQLNPIDLQNQILLYYCLLVNQIIFRLICFIFHVYCHSLMLLNIQLCSHVIYLYPSETAANNIVSLFCVSFITQWFTLHKSSACHDHTQKFLPEMPWALKTLAHSYNFNVSLWLLQNNKSAFHLLWNIQYRQSTVRIPNLLTN
jgi:hypothetical protein